MLENRTLKYTINDAIELNLSYMPFITNGGLFVPTEEVFSLNELVTLELELTATKNILKIQGKVIWITPANALHHVLSGVGIQFMGDDVQAIKMNIESYLDSKVDIGGYTYGITEKNTK